MDGQRGGEEERRGKKGKKGKMRGKNGAKRERQKGGNGRSPGPEGPGRFFADSFGIPGPEGPGDSCEGGLCVKSVDAAVSGVCSGVPEGCDPSIPPEELLGPSGPKLETELKMSSRGREPRGPKS